MNRAETTKQMLIEKIRKLPAGKLSDVLRFVEAIRVRKSPDQGSRKRALRAAGRFRSGRYDLSANHDKHLAEAWEK